MIGITIKTSENKTEEIFIARKQYYTLGRSSKCTYQISGDDQISSTHCRFFLLHNRLNVEDLDSTNGTYVNDIPIKVHKLHLGDEIRVGSTIITINKSQMSLTEKQLHARTGRMIKSVSLNSKGMGNRLNGPLDYFTHVSKLITRTLNITKDEPKESAKNKAEKEGTVLTQIIKKIFK